MAEKTNHLHDFHELDSVRNERNLLSRESERAHQKLYYYAPSPLINHGNVKCKTQMVLYFNPFLFQKPTNEKSSSRGGGGNIKSYANICKI